LQRAASVTGAWSDIAMSTAPGFRLRGTPTAVALTRFGASRKRRFGATAAGLIEYHETSPPPGQAFYRAVQT
jgi:hypothetical protein